MPRVRPPAGGPGHGLAAEAHGRQRRDTDEVPYVIHPLEAAALLHSFGLDDHVTAAAMLHDTLEDTDLTGEQIAERLDGQVIELVLALTDEERVDDDRERKAALREQVAAAGPEAAFVSPPTSSPSCASCERG